MEEDQSILSATARQQVDRRTLTAAFVVNILMFFAGLSGWRLAKSAALLADALDMLADASGYAIAYLAIGGSGRRQRAAARWNGAMLMALGLGVLGEVAYRWFGDNEPNGTWISAFACLSLLANGIVLRVLRKYRQSSEIHLRATWIDTRADVLVNIGVLIAGALVAISGYSVIDLITGVIIAGFVIHEGWELWEASASLHEPDTAS